MALKLKFCAKITKGTYIHTYKKKKHVKQQKTYVYLEYIYWQLAQ